MISNNKILKLSIISIIIFIGSFIYFEYTMMQKYFEQNLKKEQNLIVTVYNQNLKDINYRYKKRVQNIFTDENSLIVVSNIVRVAKEMGLTVVAERVATKEIEQILTMHEVEYLQGFYIGKPACDIVKV